MSFSSWFTVDALVASMIDFVGGLPLEWSPKWKELKVGAVKYPRTGEVGQGSPLSRLEQMFNEKAHEASSADNQRADKISAIGSHYGISGSEFD